MSAASGEPKMRASILVVDDDTQLRDTLTRDLRSQGYHARGAGSFREAVECLREQSYDVLLTDSMLEGGDGMALIGALPRVSPGTRPVLMRAQATARDSQRALDGGAVRVLSKPFESGEMFQAVERAAQYAGGFLASLHGLSLIDTLQMFHQTRRSLTLRVVAETPGALHMRDGELVHAEFGELSGEAALGGILRMPAGSLQTSAVEPVKPTLFREFQELLLDQLTKLDERERDSHQPDSVDALDDAWLDDASPEFTVSAAGTGSNPRTFVRAASASSTSGERPVVRLPAKHRTLEKIDIACHRIVTLVGGGVACGVVDLESGKLLGIHNIRDASGTQSELVADATIDLFRGPNVARIEAMLLGDDDSSDHVLDEVQLTSKHHLHFAKTLKGGRAVILLVTKRSTSLGMGWAQLKAAIPVLERLIP
jgi:CheY-like chemotaxis protein